MSVFHSFYLSLQACTVHIFLMEKHLGFYFTQIVYDLMLCHDFYPSSLIKCKVTGREKHIYRPDYIFLIKNIELLTSHKTARDLKVCHDVQPMSFLQIQYQ